MGGGRVRGRLLAVPVVAALAALAAPSAALASGASPQAEVVSARHPLTVVVGGTDRAGHPTWHRVRVTSEAQLAGLQRTGSVTDDPTVHLMDTAGTFDDPFRRLQWHLDRLHAEALRPLADASSVTVAVVDSGVDATNPDLAGRVLCNAGEDLVGDGRSTDGCVDPNGHGTHVAGLISAAADNGVLVAGLTDARILPIRVMRQDGSGDASVIARGIVDAVDKGADVVNLSLGGGYSAAEDTAVHYALSHNVVVVAAAGNSGASGDPLLYPGATPGVLCVAATDQSDRAAPFSEYGPQVSVAAPGVDIVSTWPGGRAASASGTSMATPIVSAVAAMYRAAHPGATVAATIAAIENSADDLGPAGRDDHYGYGLVDPLAMLSGTAPRVTPPKVAASPAPVAKRAVRRAAPPTRLRYAGHHNPPSAVRTVQRALHLRATGVFDRRTLAAVKAFQRRHHLRPTGVVDARTWQALVAQRR